MKSKKNTISVVIPFYSGYKYLIEAIKSIEKQSYLPDEVIIINDGSKENISNVSSNIVNIKIINQDNKGAAAARNVGIKNSKCEYIAFLDADDLWSDNKLEIQLNIMRKNKVFWSYHNYKRFNGTSLPKLNDNIVYSKYRIEKNFSRLANSCPIATPSVMIKKSLLLENDFKFNENLKYGEDTCLWYDLSQKYEVAVLEDNLCHVRMHGNNAAYDIEKQIMARNDLWLYICSKESLLNEIHLTTKCAYIICTYLYKLIDSQVFKSMPNLLREFFCRILYFFPWCIFKIKYKFMKGRIL